MTWDEVFESGILAYEVVYQPDVLPTESEDIIKDTTEGGAQNRTFMDGTENASLTLNTTKRYVKLIDLMEFTTYNISVRAFNAQGPGPYSRTVAATTEEDDPTSIPTEPSLNVTTVAISSTSIAVLWEDSNPDSRNGTATTYTVVYQAHGSDSLEGALNTTNRSVVLIGLSEFRMYQITVYAHVTTEEGVMLYRYSESVLATTLENSKSCMCMIWSVFFW